MKRCAWLDLRCPACSGAPAATVAVGYGGSTSPAAVRSVEARRFGRACDVYLSWLNEVVEAGWVPFVEAGRAELEEVAAAREGHVRSKRDLYDLLLDGVLPPPEDHAVVAARCEHLLMLPIAPLAAAADPERYRREGLPLDLHPRLGVEGARRAACERGAWPAPRTRDVTMLLGDDFGEEVATTPTADGRLEVDSLGAAAALRSALDRARAVDHATARGARILPLTVGGLVAAIVGELGPYVQIVARMSEDERGRPLLLCSDAAADIAALVERIEGRAAAGLRSTVRAADLTACQSSEALSHAFHAAGVVFASSFPVLLHPAIVSRGLRLMYELDLLDGETPFQHEWIWASLG